MWFDKLIEKDGSVRNELILDELNNCISGVVKQIGHVKVFAIAYTTWISIPIL